MRGRPIGYWIVLGGLFVALCAAGICLAQRKPIWNDERYTQLSSVQGFSYVDIWMGKVGEGNNAPLFYTLQKLITSVAGYHAGPRFDVDETQSTGRVILRLLPVGAMSFAIVCMIAFAWAWYGPLAALYTLILALSTQLLWLYWAEARHYALWVALTALQVCLVWDICRQTEAGKEQERAVGKAGAIGLIAACLIVVHGLLAFTVILSLPQIVLVSSVLFWRSKNIKVLVLGGIVPVILCLVYYALAPKFSFWVEYRCEQYIRSAIPRDRLYIVLIAGLGIAYAAVQRQLKWPAFLVKEFMRCGVMVFLVGGMIAASVLLIAAFNAKAGAKTEGFPVTDRYFIQLTVFGIVGAVVCGAELIKTCRHWTAKAVIVIAMAALSGAQIAKVAPKIIDFLSQTLHS